MPARFLHLLFLLVLLLGGIGCYAPQEEEPDIIVTLDPEFIVDLFEYRDPLDGAATFGLWVESMDTYPCGNYTVEAITQLTNKAIDIQLLEIEAPDNCLGAPAPARGFLPIGALANGDYTLTLSLNPVLKSTGTLSVQNGHYELNLSDPGGVDFQNRVLEQLPDDYLWGYANTPSEQDQPIAAQLIQELKPLSLDSQLPPGFYSYFTVTGTGSFFFHRSIAPADQFQGFLRRLSGPPNAVRPVLQAYRDDGLQPLDIYCLSTFGAL